MALELLSVLCTFGGSMNRNEISFDPNSFRIAKRSIVERRNRPFSYSTKEPGSSDIFIHFYTRCSIEWR